MKPTIFSAWSSKKHGRGVNRVVTTRCRKVMAGTYATWQIPNIYQLKENSDLPSSMWVPPFSRRLITKTINNVIPYAGIYEMLFTNVPSKFRHLLCMRSLGRLNENKRENWSPHMSGTLTMFDECIVFLWNVKGCQCFIVISTDFTHNSFICHKTVVLVTTRLLKLSCLLIFLEHYEHIRCALIFSHTVICISLLLEKNMNNIYMAI